MKNLRWNTEDCFWRDKSTETSLHVVGDCLPQRRTLAKDYHKTISYRSAENNWTITLCLAIADTVNQMNDGNFVINTETIPTFGIRLSSGQAL